MELQGSELIWQDLERDHEFMETRRQSGWNAIAEVGAKSGVEGFRIEWLPRQREGMFHGSVDPDLNGSIGCDIEPGLG